MKYCLNVIQRPVCSIGSHFLLTRCFHPPNTNINSKLMFQPIPGPCRWQVFSDIDNADLRISSTLAVQPMSDGCWPLTRAAEASCFFGIQYEAEEARPRLTLRRRGVFQHFGSCYWKPTQEKGSLKHN